MNKLKILIGAVLLTLGISLAWAGLASAQSFHSGGNVVIGQGETVNSTLYAAGRTIDINSEVFGDIFCAGQTVTVSGTVHGDVICAGQTVNVTGKVDGDVRLAGQTVTIGADVAGNATVAGQTLNLESTGKIGGDLTVGSSDATLNGPVGRDIVAGGNSLTLTNLVGRNVQARVNNLRLNASADVKGNISYTSSNTLQRASGATVGGTITRIQPTAKQASSPVSHLTVLGFGLAWLLYWFLAFLFMAMALILLFPRAFQATTDRAMPWPWKALLTGFLANLAFPFVLFLLAITIIGIPLALMVGLLWFVALLLSGPVFAYYLGRMILRESRQPLLIMLVGAVVLLVAYFIPVLGLLALAASIWTGSGMILQEAFGRTPKPVYSLAKPAPTAASKSRPKS